MPGTWISVMTVLGHILIGAVFVRGGIMHFLSFAETAQGVAARGVPLPRCVLAIGSVFQIIFGALLIVGMAVTISACALLVFTVIASWMLLNFWDKKGAEREAAKTNMESNVAIVGGLLLVAVQAWPT